MDPLGMKVTSEASSGLAGSYEGVDLNSRLSCFGSQDPIP